MSSYIQFFINTGGDNYIEIDAFSRSTMMYQLFADFFHYGEPAVPLTVEQRIDMYDTARSTIREYKDDIKKLKEKKEFVATFNNSMEDKLNEIYSIDTQITEIKNGIRELKSIMIFLDVLYNMEGNMQYNLKTNDNYIYCGVECGAPGDEDYTEEVDL